MAITRLLLLPLLFLLALGLGYAVVSLPEQTLGLRKAVDDNLAVSGVSNPVTAVLLNFRGYDTFLEMVVLLLALLGVWSLGDRNLPYDTSSGVVLANLVRFLVPILVLVAGYLLWTGAHAPGGAFQAGSLLGAAGVLLLLTGWRIPPSLAILPLRLLLVAGSVSFLIIGLLTLLTEGHMLRYPQSSAGVLILLIETAATLSIGVTLMALFIGSRPSTSKDMK